MRTVPQSHRCEAMAKDRTGSMLGIDLRQQNDEFGGDTEWAARVGAYVCGRGADALWPTLTED